MQQRRIGQTAIIGSIAGFRGVERAPGYSASKAAAKTYGEALLGALKKHKINCIGNVSWVC